MKRTAIIVLCLVSAYFGIASARPHGLGLGLMGGDPSGFSAKLWTGGNTALDAGFGYSYLWYGSAPHLHGDILWHTANAIDDDDGYLPFYFGLGVHVKFSDYPNYPYTRYGVRVPFGLEYVFPVLPLGLFAEIVPVFDVRPWPEFLDLNGSVGFRVYLGGED